MITSWSAQCFRLIKPLALLLAFAVLPSVDNLVIGEAQTADRISSEAILVQISGRKPFRGNRIFRFQLPLAEGVVRIVEDAEKSGFPSFEDHREIISRLIKRIEERLNKSNVAELQQLVSEEFQSDLESYHRYQGYLTKTIPFDTTKYRDIVAYQDGTVLKNLNPESFSPNPQLSYALHHQQYFSFGPVLDLQTLSLHHFTVPKDFRGYFRWSPEGKLIAFYQSSRPAHLLVMSVPHGEVVFSKNFERYIDSVAWGHDSKSVAILNSSVRIGLAPHELLFACSGHPVGHNTYYIDVINIDTGECKEFPVVRNIIGGWGQVFWSELKRHN
jgi:hypothetical protein